MMKETKARSGDSV